MISRSSRYPGIERGVLIAALLACVAVGFAGHLPEREGPPVRPSSPPHATHKTLACAQCHGSDPRKPAQAMAQALLCTECHHPMQALAYAPELATARDAYFSGACANCHPVEHALRRTRPGPDLRQARMKLTREWTYRFLSEPWAWQPQAASGSHHLRPEKNPATTVAKTRAMVTALCGNSDRPSYVARSSDTAAADKLLSACTGCHKLDRLGSKVGRAWLDAFLQAPRAHAPDSSHPDPHFSRADAQLVSDRLLARHDPTFEPRWPVLDRATVDATDQLLEQYLPGSELMSAAQAKKEAALGAKLLEAEGCAGCHTMIGAAPAQRKITREPNKAQKVHIAHYSAQPAAATAFASMLRKHAASTFWPKPRLPSAEGEALAAQAGCSACHNQLAAGRACDAEHTLTAKSHDFGLDAEARAALIGHFAGDHICQGIR